MTCGHIFKVSTSIGVIRVKQIIISTYSYRQQVEEYINKRLEILPLEGIKLDIQIEDKGKTTFVTCSFLGEIPKSKERRYFKEYIIIPVAKAMVDIIQEEFTIDFANEVLQTTWGSNEIVITRMLEDKEQTKKLLDPIITELMANTTFCLDGWIRFRLSPYKMVVMDKIENLIYEYEAYKEYEEFISLLKSYVLKQPSLINKIHLIPNGDGRIDLYNEKKEYMDLDMEEYACWDDLILGTLLTLVPLRMIIHKEVKCKNTKLIDTIKGIYEDRVTFCKSCKYCNKSGFKIGFVRALKEFLTQKKV